MKRKLQTFREGTAQIWTLRCNRSSFKQRQFVKVLELSDFSTERTESKDERLCQSGESPEKDGAFARTHFRSAKRHPAQSHLPIDQQ